MSDTLQVEKRSSTGTASSRRLRREGKIPAVLYGHGEGNEHLAVRSRDVSAALRHHSKTVSLDGDVKDTALLADIQYDPLGIDVLHLDLIRVNLKEEVEVTVPIHLRGEAEGSRNGGILLENLHEVDIRCPAGSIPESLDLEVTQLKIGEHLSAGDLQLPDGVTLVTDTDTVVAHIEAPKAAKEETDAPADGEPEVIAKGGGDEANDSEDG